MWPMMQLGLATMIVDFTSGLSPLIIGLLSILWLSAGFIIFAAIQEHRSRKTAFLEPETRASEDHRDAA